MEAQQEMAIPTGDAWLEGDLMIPASATGLVVFAHGSGSSRFSPRNRHVAQILREAGLGTLLFDLLTAEDERVDVLTGKLRFDIDFLARRLVAVTTWLQTLEQVKEMRLGYFGSSTGGGAALVAAAQLGKKIGAVVSRGGRPDLAMSWLKKVQSPTLLLVGELDSMVLDLNRDAMERMSCPTELRIIPNATHLFEEPGTLESVAHEAAKWFRLHLAPL